MQQPPDHRDPYARGAGQGEPLQNKDIVQARGYGVEVHVSAWEDHLMKLGSNPCDLVPGGGRCKGIRGACIPMARPLMPAIVLLE